MSAGTMAPIERREAPAKSEGAGAWALIGIETKHLLRSILIGIGVVGAVVATFRGSSGEWPTLAGADGVALRAGDFMGAFALLAGAWLGLRDNRTGAHELVGSTPTPPGSVRGRRLLSLAIVSTAAFSLVFLTSIAYAFARGGRGSPDLRLLLDGALATTLASWVGFGIGTLTRSIVVSLFAAPIYGLLSSQGLTYQLNIWKSHASYQWITPSATLPDRSPTLGFFPDIFWLHPLFLAGVATFLFSFVIVAVRQGSIGQRLRGPSTGVLVLGLATALIAGGSLLAKPDGYAPNGSDPTAWVARYDAGTALFADKPFRFADDHRATTCASGRVLTACVYPAYGPKLARLIVTEFEAEAELFHGLPGVPTKIRMVPAEGLDCLTKDGAMAFTEGDIYFLNDQFSSAKGAFVDCITKGSLFGLIDTQPSDARDAIKVWYLLERGVFTPAQASAALAEPPGQACTGPNGETCFDVVQILTAGSWTPASVRAALAMKALPVADVIRGLRPVWAGIRAGTLPLERLPGQAS